MPTSLLGHRDGDCCGFLVFPSSQLLDLNLQRHGSIFFNHRDLQIRQYDADSHHPSFVFHTVTNKRSRGPMSDKRLDRQERKKTNCMRSEQPEESRWFYSMRIMWHTRKSFTKLGSNGRTNVCSTTERWLWCKFIEQCYRSYQPLCQLIIRWNPSKSPGPAVRSELGRRFETSPNGSLEEI